MLPAVLVGEGVRVEAGAILFPSPRSRSLWRTAALFSTDLTVPPLADTLLASLSLVFLS